jgi:hypothetical protein
MDPPAVKRRRGEKAIKGTPPLARFEISQFYRRAAAMRKSSIALMITSDEVIGLCAAAKSRLLNSINTSNVILRCRFAAKSLKRGIAWHRFEVFVY